MTDRVSNTDLIIPQPSWEGVRTIYKKLSEEFHVLTSTFDVVIDPKTCLHLDHLIIAIDEIDNCVDELETKEQRDSITESLVDYLSNESKSWSHECETETLSKKVQNLKLVIRLLGIESQFIAAAKSIFHHTEVKRHTTDSDKLIEYILLEGQSTALLPLSIIGTEQGTPFAVFFTSLCRLMGIADLIIDARTDYSQGYIISKPTLNLYLRLIKIVVTDGWKLVINIPRKFRFIQYCLKFGVALIKG